MSKESALNLTAQNPQPAPVVPPADVPQKEDVVIDSRRLALFAKKEKAIQDEREKLKREAEEFKKQREQVDAVQKRANEFEALRAKDPIAALKLLGFSEADIFNFLAEGEKSKDPATQAAQIAKTAAEEATKKLREELEEKEKKSQTERNAAAIAQLKTDIGETLKAKPELKFCAFKGKEAEDQVFEYIDQVLKDHGVLLSPEEAFKDVEELYKAEYDALLEYAKPKEAVEAAPAPEPPKVKPPVQGSTPPKTITNRVSATASAVANAVPKKETREEKRARLEQALRQGHL